MPDDPKLPKAPRTMIDVNRYAQSLVREAQADSDRRLRQARELATLMKLVDPETADDLIRTVRATNQRELELTQQQACTLISLAQPQPEPDAALLGPATSHRQGPGPEDHLQAVLSKTTALVEEAALTSRTHLEDAERLAELVRQVDPEAAERILAATRTTNAARMDEARLTAEGVATAARTRSLAVIGRFAEMLAEEAERATARRTPRAERLTGRLERLNPELAARLRTVITSSEEARAQTARVQATELADRTQHRQL